MEHRLQKILSDYGIASRRKAEKLISDGKVRVNNIQASLGDKADPDRDKIKVDGVEINARPKRVYIMLNKPKGYVTTMEDEKGRRIVTDLLTGLKEKVYPVGRLDMDSEGLLLLTNDGELANRLTHPKYQVSKTYRVWVRGKSIARAADILRGDMTIDGQRLNRALLSNITDDGERGIIDITISEGKNRQVRKMCKQADLEVTRLMRVSESGLNLGNLPKGKWRYLSDSEIEHIKSV